MEVSSGCPGAAAAAYRPRLGRRGAAHHHPTSASSLSSPSSLTSSTSLSPSSIPRSFLLGWSEWAVCISLSISICLPIPIPIPLTRSHASPHRPIFAGGCLCLARHRRYHPQRCCPHPLLSQRSRDRQLIHGRLQEACLEHCRQRPPQLGPKRPPGSTERKDRATKEGPVVLRGYHVHWYEAHI